MKPFEELVKHVKKECKKHGVRFYKGPGKYVWLKDSNIKCGGYFNSEPEQVLAYASKSEEYKTLIAHEYCHMTQWLDKIPLWDISENSLVVVDNWLNGFEVENIQQHLSNCRDLELDNEIRTSKLFDEYDFGQTKEEYIKKCNAYILFYNYLYYSRSWSKPGNSAYGNKRILEAMSDKFDMNYSELSPELLKLFKEENI
jgi:hypothetical protein